MRKTCVHPKNLIIIANSSILYGTSGRSTVVVRSVRDREAAGSIPVAPTMKGILLKRMFFFLISCCKKERTRAAERVCSFRTDARCR